MTLLLEFDEFRGLPFERFMEELDKILIISIDKLRDSMDLRRRVMMYPIFEKVIQYRKVELLTPEKQMEQDPQIEQTF
ncbi:unnamed protein product [Caenorhabditis nigoni]